MNEKKEDPSGMTSMIDTWIKSMGDFWGSMAGRAPPHPMEGSVRLRLLSARVP